MIAHNRYYHRSGYTPYQRAFGILPRLPASLLSDDFIDKELILNGAGDEVKRSWEIREAAGNAWLRWQDNDAVRRAISTRTRTSDNKVFKEGDLVYVWRDVPNFKGWSGPGTIVAQHSNGKSLWVSLRGYLVKASREQIRHATSEESLGAELVKNLSQDMLQDLESGKRRSTRRSRLWTKHSTQGRRTTAYSRRRDCGPGYGDRWATWSRTCTTSRTWRWSSTTCWTTSTNGWWRNQYPATGVSCRKWVC